MVNGVSVVIKGCPGDGRHPTLPAVIRPLALARIGRVANTTEGARNYISAEPPRNIRQATINAEPIHQAATTATGSFKTVPVVVKQTSQIAAQLHTAGISKIYRIPNYI